MPLNFDQSVVQFFLSPWYLLVMTRRRVLVALLLSLSMISAPSFVAPVQAANVEDCRIKASDWQQLSLGFPIRPERLAKLSAPRILVVPFQLQDTPDYTFSSDLKQNYETAASYINDFSNGKSKPQFIFSPVIKTEITQSDIRILRSNQNIGNQRRDESISTWGFVRSFVTKYDVNLDFTGVDGVILEGSSSGTGIGEAMTYIRNYDPYWRPLKTDEGEVLNAVLMDGHWGSATIAHEVMHLYGLTDLYGSSTGPGRLSLMASNSLNLLSYEKWVLGWLPDSEVTCIPNLSTSSIIDFSFDYSKFDQLAVLRAPNEDPYIVEITRSGGTKYIAFYSLNIEGRPPITLHEEKGRAQSGGKVIGDYMSIGLQLNSPSFTLLITNIEANKISLSLASTSQIDSAQFKDLISKASETRSQYELEALNKAAAEMKAIQDAEAKAAADKLSSAKAIAQKKVTITCVKGKTTKKITAVSPKCPAGFKRKR